MLDDQKKDISLTLYGIRALYEIQVTHQYLRYSNKLMLFVIQVKYDKLKQKLGGNWLMICTSEHPFFWSKGKRLGNDLRHTVARKDTYSTRVWTQTKV